MLGQPHIQGLLSRPWVPEGAVCGHQKVEGAFVRVQLIDDAVHIGACHCPVFVCVSEKSVEPQVVPDVGIQFEEFAHVRHGAGSVPCNGGQLCSA